MATKEQERAIKARGEVLVSASAGAGKTTVMIQRLADILINDADLDEVLAVTFTRKAAAQMKEKLRKELIIRLGTEEGYRAERLRKQLNKINTADISTIHSFCVRLIRTYFYALKVDASFEVLVDGAEANALRGNTLDELFDRLYRENDPDLMLLLERLRKKRSDRTLKELILDSYKRIRQLPDYLKITEAACANTYCEDGFREVARCYAKSLGARFTVLAEAVEAYRKEFVISRKPEGYYAVLDETAQTLRQLAASDSPFNYPVKLSRDKPGFPKKLAEENPELAAADAEFGKFNDKIKARYKALREPIGDELKEMEKFLKSGEVARAYFSVIKRFDEAYSAAKREEGKLDLSDLEHFALALLRGDDCDEDVRASVQAKYRYVFVDEYQDVNPIQNEIISAVAAGDTFCVGDLKQAIYGFRGSSSRFFADKCEAMGNMGGKGHYIVLPDNFRSSKKVIKFVNDVFSEVMRPPFTEFNYRGDNSGNNGHEMRGGSLYAEGCDGLAEICLYSDESGKKTAEDVYSVESDLGGKEFTAEGRAVLTLVEEALKSKYYDTDSKRLVNVEPKDICVLTRKLKKASVLEIVRALASRYPVSGASEANICNRPEIIRILNVLSFLDNAEQDVPLTAALLSPLGRLTERELACIRIYGGVKWEKTFGACCKEYAEKKCDYVAEKLNAFYREADRLRSLARNIGVSRLIDEIMRVGDFALAYDTEEKLAALRRLQEEAYAPAGELQLGAFLQKVRDADYEIKAPTSLISDCIKVMTMHTSKGLEFPVVIVADIAASFKGDNKDEMPYAEDFGFAPRYFDGDTRAYGTTILRNLYKMRRTSEELRNEINLFYVACTRAKYALYVLTSEAESYDFVRANFTNNYSDLFDVKSFAPRLLPNECGLGEYSGGAKRVLDDSRADERVLEKLTSVADWEYTFATGVDLPVKSSASRLISEREGAENAVNLFEDEFERSELQGADSTVGGHVIKHSCGPSSRSEGEGKVTAAEAGIAYHRFLELCDFSVKDKAGVEAQLERWFKEGKITTLQREILNADELTRILSLSALDELGSYRLFREREFICRLPSGDYCALRDLGRGGKDKFDVGGDDGNGVICQGAIDLLAVQYKDGKAISARIIDYKYSGHTDGEIRQKYAPQLALYRSVVCKIYRLDESKVTTTILNIKSCRQIDM